jgi:hypothetical protein
MMSKIRVRDIYCVLFAVLCPVLVNNPAWGSATGLNNIPTTDIVPERTLVWQGWVNAAGGERTYGFIGFKYGLFQDAEIGVDWKALDADIEHGHAMLQAKYAFDMGQSDVWRGVVGFADLSDNHHHNPEWFPYMATSLDLKAFRLHFGFAPQPHNERFFGGFDKTVSFLDRNLQLRFDGIHINDKQDMLFSAGFLYELAPRTGGNKTQQTGLAGFLDNIAKNIILESWVSKPSTGDKETYTVKLNYVIAF